jgi:predicted neuraminidase
MNIPSPLPIAVALLAALLLAWLAPLCVAEKAAAPNPDQLGGVDPDEGTTPQTSGEKAPPRLIPDPGHTADYTRAKRTCTGVPSLAVSKGGRLWAAWFSGTTPGEIIERCPHAYSVVSTSGDGGKTWKEVLAIDPDGPGPLKAYDPRPWIDPNGKLWVFFTLPYPTHKHCWAITAPDGEQESPAWSEPRPIVEGVLLNQPTVLANGDWLLPTYARRPNDMGAVLAHVSSDQGKTFAVKGQLKAPWKGTFPSEPMAVERKDGSLWMLLRTNQGIGESTSTDGGATWTPLKTPAIQHTPSRFYIGRLQSGNLLLVKHLGIDEDPLSQGKPKQRRELTAFLSKDDGKTWSPGLLLDERVGCSYPDAAQAADGTIYLSWDFMRSRDQEVWLTTFREEDVFAADGEAVARVKAQRRLVTKGGTPDQ